MSFTGKINWLAIYSIMALVCIAYFPNIISSPGVYKIVIACIGLFVGLFLFTSFPRFWSAFGKYLILFTIFYLLVSVFVYLYYNKDYFIQSSNFYISLICFSLGFLAPNINTKKINIAIGIYCVFSAIMGVYSVLRNIGSFMILDEYLILLKNSSGVIVATATILSLYLCFCSMPLSFKTFWIFIASLNFASLLVFRARGALLGLLCVCTIVFFKNIKSSNNPKQRQYTVLLLIIILFLSLSDIISFDMIYDSLFANKDTSSIDSVSSGRTVMFERAYQFFLRDTLGGQLASNHQLKSVDNYLINQLGRFGLIGIITNVPIYIFIWVITLKGIIKNTSMQSVPYYALLILCIVSLTEASYPFGPGTPCMCAFVLLGFFLNLSNSCKGHF